jgi:dihydrofolate synthase/folylpolyglutamate synthase
MNYHDVLEYMYAQLPMFHRVGPAAYKPGLDNTHRLLEIVGNPHLHLRTVHIAGTNGKGSTSHLIASVLQEAGNKTGLCTSPHLKDFRERIRINGNMIPQQAVVEFVETYRSSWESIQPSFFEITIALCFWFFHREKIDIAVIETGLGGRLDSTNVIMPEVSVITNIGMDHMNLLGDSIELIAAEKAGIIKSNITVVAGPMKPEALNIITQHALAKKAVLINAASLSIDTVPPTCLRGHYQDENRRTAFAALMELKRLGWLISDEHIRSGYQRVIENTSLLGRWQQLSDAPLIIADVAHNEDGIQVVLNQIRETTHEQLHFVLGLVSDKDVDRVLKLLPGKAIYYFCKANIPRGMPAAELAKRAEAHGLRGNSYDSVQHAFSAAKNAAGKRDLVFIGGSVFTVAEVL